MSGFQVGSWGFVHGEEDLGHGAQCLLGQPLSTVLWPQRVVLGQGKEGRRSPVVRMYSWPPVASCQLGGADMGALSALLLQPPRTLLYRCLIPTLLGGRH